MRKHSGIPGRARRSPSGGHEHWLDRGGRLAYGQPKGDALMNMFTAFTTSVALAAVFSGGGAAAWAQKLDDGLLDPGWFGGELEFRRTDDIDYLWVKPGFDLKGRTLFVDTWDDPAMLARKKRDPKDAAKASELTDTFPGRLRGALSLALDGTATVSRKSGDVVVVGRIVDCNAGSKAAKWIIGMGAGASNATWDVKFVDRASGELLLAVHHRVISGTTMSEVDDKIIKWLEKFAEALKEGARAVYDNGKPIRE